MPFDSSPPIPVAVDRTRISVIYAALILAMFMAGLDNQIVITALPTIVADLGGIERFAWVTTAYLLASSATMPLYGKLGDLFGRKPVFLFAVALFLLGSAACGLAPSMTGLIAARFFQGLGAGGLMVSVFSIIADLYPPRERARYLAYSSSVFLLSNIVGPFFGGLFSQTIGWRWIFLLNLPIGGAVLALVWLKMAGKRMPGKTHVDVPGAVLLALFISGLVVLTDTAGRNLSWSSPLVLGLSAVTIISLLGWLRVESKSPEPIVPLGLFRDSTFSLCCLISVTAGMSSLGVISFVALFYQVVIEAPPTVAGLLQLPASLAMVVTSNLVGQRMARTGHYKWYPVAGMVFGAAMIVALLNLGPGSPIWLGIPTMVLFGIGIGLSQQVLLAAVQNTVQQRVIGAATGTLHLTRMAGAALGLSAYGAIFANRLGPSLDAAGIGFDGASLSPSALAALDAGERLSVSTAYGEALHAVFLATLLPIAVAFAAALALKPRRLGTTQRSD